MRVGLGERLILYAVCMAIQVSGNLLSQQGTNEELLKELGSREEGEAFEGDMLLTEEQKQALLGRKLITEVAKKWPEGADGYPRVPYRFADPLLDRARVKKAIDHWEKHTCLRFEEVPFTATEPHLIFRHSNLFCSSSVGRLTKTFGQPVYLKPICVTTIGSTIHEIGHSVGFWHEQSRQDRDQHILYFPQNVVMRDQYNFFKHPSLNYGAPYDYASDMHYRRMAFTSNGKYTMMTKPILAHFLLGSRIGLSHFDKLQANTHYGCIEKWRLKCKLPSHHCKNHGYVGRDCKCVCTPGTQGATCQDIKMSYTDAMIKKLTPDSRVVTRPGVLQTPKPFPNDYKVIWHVKAPQCKHVRCTVNYSEMYGRVGKYCLADYVDIRTSNMYEGEFFCGKELRTGRVFQSKQSEMVIAFKGYDYTWPNKNAGFSAKISFVAISGCIPKGNREPRKVKNLQQESKATPPTG